MLSERIATLYRLLQCKNTDIARFAGCSSGNISRLRSGNRVPKPRSRTIALLVNGLYGYADYENLLDELRELCGAADSSRETLLPALAAWLYETDEVNLPKRVAVPRSKRTRVLMRRSFGERLDRAMDALELSNGQLAALLSVDDSLVSRWRAGSFSPHGNRRLAERLSAVLFSRAEKNGKLPLLAELCGAEAPDEAAVSAWLYDVPEADPAELAQMLLRSLDGFTPRQGLPAGAPEPPPVEAAERYWGTAGLRSAVVRFLTDAIEAGGELLLYSDEPMDWMSGDREFFALWSSLMVRCVESGVRIRIIHNLDRSAREMAAAFTGWLPLYVSGAIEPYVFLRERSARFCYTAFLRAGGACVFGAFPAGAGERRWYDYVTDPERLEALDASFRTMLAGAKPFLRTYTAETGGEFRALRAAQTGPRRYLLSELPLFTMPEDLLTRILARAGAAPEQRADALDACRALRARFLETLRTDSVELLLCPCGAGAGRVSFPLDLLDLSVAYTAEEYAEHVAAVRALIRDERNFHLTLLPAAPFRDIQLITLGESVAVLRCGAPGAAFVFTNSMLTRSVSDYLGTLAEEHAADRAAASAALERLAARRGERE